MAQLHWIVERAPRDEDTDPMLSFVTGRLSGRDDMARMIAALEARGIPHSVVRKPPFADYLVEMASERRVELLADGPVFAYGSTTLELVAKKHGWSPGFIDGPGMIECVDRWGAHMLNVGAHVHTIADMPKPDAPVFIRPETDGKAFAGAVIEPEDFDDWRGRIMDIKGWTNVPPTLRVLVAPPIRIQAEWRMWISRGRVATASIYRDGRHLRTELGAPTEVVRYAEERAAEWSPRPIYVMDVAETERGLKIVETNSYSSAGLYAADVDHWISAVERGL